MANKKFYYHGKKKEDKHDLGAAKPDVKKQSPKYDASKLDTPLDNLNLSAGTTELLSKNGVKTAADLVRRTEKDMFRIQGLNKRVLFEVRDSLKSLGMEFKPDSGQAVPPSAQNERKPTPAGARRERPSGESRAPKSRNEVSKSKSKTEAAAPVKPVKLTEPLPVPEWRKIQKGGKWGFYDGFKTVIPAMYDEVFSFKEGLASVELEEKCGYINENNEIVIPLEYETALSFSGGYASVVKNGKCGYIDKDNCVIIPFEYDAATPFEDGEAKVKKDGRWGTITPDGAVKWI